jgi:co-chaperonin GroES (HSP10)
MTVNIWDKVLCGQYAGDEVKFEDIQYKIVSIDYLLAVISE